MGRDNSIEVKDDLVDYSPTSRNNGLTFTPKFIGEERKKKKSGKEETKKGCQSFG